MNFKEWFDKGLKDFANNGFVTLYHFSNKLSKNPKTTIVTQPEKVGSNSFTLNDMRASSVPRTFFYLDLKDKERYFENAPLYKATVPASKIYDIKEDPLQIKEKLRSQNYGALNITQLVDEIYNNPNFDGMYYEPNMHVVAWFYPLELTFADEEEERRLNVPVDDRGGISRAS